MTSFDYKNQNTLRQAIAFSIFLLWGDLVVVVNDVIMQMSYCLDHSVHEIWIMRDFCNFPIIRKTICGNRKVKKVCQRLFIFCWRFYHDQLLLRHSLFYWTSLAFRALTPSLTFPFPPFMPFTIYAFYSISYPVVLIFFSISPTFCWLSAFAHVPVLPQPLRSLPTFSLPLSPTTGTTLGSEYSFKILTFDSFHRE